MPISDRPNVLLLTVWLHRPANVVQRKEEHMTTGAVSRDSLRPDGRYGCRGGEVANNTQNRRIACC